MAKIIKETVLETIPKTPETAPVQTIKNFKHSGEVEHFYRFIHENKLREEAKTLIALVLRKITPPKRRGRKKILQ